ncbi:MAG: hypothetical protein U0Q18_00635 [Bryobacteraceae bacterium]
MRTDLYTKVVFTAIGIFLGIVALRPYTAPAGVKAQDTNHCGCLVFDPNVTQIITPDGQSSVPGRVAIDVRTGNIYGFPSDPVGYPRDPGRNRPATSDPVLLGRFNLEKISATPYSR